MLKNKTVLNKISIKFLNLIFLFLLYLKSYKSIKILKFLLKAKNYKSSKLYFFYAKMYLRERKYIIAEIFFKKYLLNYQNDFLAKSYLGITQLSLGNSSECKNIIDELDKINYENLIFNLLKAEYYFFVKEMKFFKINAEKCLSASKKFNYLYEKLITNSLNEGDLKNAEYYAKTLKKDKKFLCSAILHLAYISLYKGNTDLGKKYITNLISKFPNYYKGYYLFVSLSLHIKYPKLKNLILNNNKILSKLDKNKISVLFARSRIYKDEKNYYLSSKYLKMANNLKLKYFPSNYKFLIQQSTYLLLNFKSFYKDQVNVQNKICSSKIEYIFIVGLPRCGSTLLEKILSVNKNIMSIGESTKFEERLLSWLKDKKSKEFHYRPKGKKIILDKNLYNFKYVGYICKLLPSARIIHCVRNPLDNILSLYYSNLAENSFSSSIEDSSNFLLHQRKVMEFYKKLFQEKIFTINYEDIVFNSKNILLELINWLEIEWSDNYLQHQKIKSICETASYIQVRSSIYNTSVNQSKNYKNLLKPAIKILNQNISD